MSLGMFESSHLERSLCWPSLSPAHATGGLVDDTMLEDVMYSYVEYSVMSRKALQWLK